MSTVDETTSLRSDQPQASPTLRPVMYQRWDDLIFMHWRYDATEIAARLPKQLVLDTYLNEAYMSIVAFRMNCVRPAGLPALPWLSYFLELNVRTYVRSVNGEPGIFFFSLDCDRAPAVWIARAAFKLPYMHASMSFVQTADTRSPVGYTQSMLCCRTGHHETAEYSWSLPSALAPTNPGSLEFFLTERYNFFTVRRGKLMRGQVYHKPYKIGTPILRSWSSLPIAWNDFSPVDHLPEIVSYSPGVSISAYRLATAK
ncbi:MAG: YqjF family protein [Pseudomonadota bacterium]|jgi:uncharacterized protein YqjF (DUF2071 family)